MEYILKTTKAFKKDFKRCQKQGLPMEKLRSAMETLKHNGSLPSSFRPHQLHGDRKGQWECHIQSDWLLVWEQNDTELILLMLNTGTHSELFDKKKQEIITLNKTR
ncbi:MAG: type II toxin-antitoxin system YafQ family toxin [Prevotella sp.]|nr:type II toxin-antitoxin system YafQ family toxin [Prevotella sp.]